MKQYRYIVRKIGLLPTVSILLLIEEICRFTIIEIFAYDKEAVNYILFIPQSLIIFLLFPNWLKRMRDFITSSMSNKK